MKLQLVVSKDVAYARNTESGYKGLLRLLIKKINLIWFRQRLLSVFFSDVSFFSHKLNRNVTNSLANIAIKVGWTIIRWPDFIVVHFGIISGRGSFAALYRCKIILYLFVCRSFWTGEIVPVLVQHILHKSSSWNWENLWRWTNSSHIWTWSWITPFWHWQGGSWQSTQRCSGKDLQFRFQSKIQSLQNERSNFKNEYTYK